MRICATTIVSANYLAYAKVLAASVRQHFANADFRVLVVDRKTPTLTALAATMPFAVLWAEELGLSDFERIAYRFDILELNTGLKPTLLKRLLNEGYDAVIYWDPDIRLFAAPTPVIAALHQASVVLTPHTQAPMMDGRRPSDVDILRSGIYNLGFVAVRGDATGCAMLDWWEDMCLSLGFNDPTAGIFVDQKWMDLAFCYFDAVFSLKHRGCNAAYWNLHERPISDSDAGIRAGADPLVFFHFSGIDARHPERLSKYQNRHELVPDTVLHRLVAAYCADLLAAGHLDYLPIPYGFGVLSDGRPVTGLMRRAQAVIGAQDERPFDAAGPMQRELLRAGMAPRDKGQVVARPEAKINSLNFDHRQGVVATVNRALRLAVRVIGLNRVQMLLRYFSFLARGSNLASALTGAPFDLNPQLRSATRSASTAGSVSAGSVSPSPAETLDDSEIDR